MSQTQSIDLYLYPSVSNEDLYQDVLHSFVKSGLASCWFKINFMSPDDPREHNYVDEYFVFEQTKEETLLQCGRVIEVYLEWLKKVGTRIPDKEVSDAFTRSHTPIDRPLKDSGERRDFSTGSRRDVATGKGRYDLLPFEVIDALAKHYEKGYQKYDPDHVWSEVDNWQKGQPLSVFLDSGLRHAFKWKAGMKDEDHLIAAIWNLIAAWWTQDAIRKGELPIELGDTGELWRENRDLTKGVK